MSKFIKNTHYYNGVVFEFNLPTGHTCPYAKECFVSVDRQTGKFSNESKEFRCYASAAERFPVVRESRWSNYDEVKQNIKPILPKEANLVRIHASGDFFNQEYFDMWIEIAKENPSILFWAYTKSIPFWVARLNEMPINLVLTGSYGGKYDDLIEKYNLKCTKVFSRKDVKFLYKRDGIDYVKHITSEVIYPVDYNDDLAKVHNLNFCLLNNHDKIKNPY